jgi:hypothetical protein
MNYGMKQQTVYTLGDSVSKLGDSLAELETVTGVIREGQKTLLAVPEDYYNKWATYYFRKPVGLYYIGPFFSVLTGRTLSNDANYDYVLVNHIASSLKYPDRIIMQNRLFTFSYVQPFVQFTENGWYEREIIKGKDARWMQNRAELLAFTRDPETIRLRMRASPGPDRKPKTLTLSLDGAPIGTFAVQSDSVPLETPEFALAPGFHKIVLATKEDVTPHGPDPRILNLLFEELQIVPPMPAKLRCLNVAQPCAVAGLTPDAWVTAEGITFTLPVQSGSLATLLIRGDLPNVPQVVPQTLNVTVSGGIRRSVTISMAGTFSAAVPLDIVRADKVEISLKPSASFVPRQLGINPDPRALAVRLDSVEMTSR